MNCNQGTLHLGKSGPENLHKQRFDSLSAQPLPVMDRAHSKRFFPYVKSAPFQLVFLRKLGIHKQIKYEAGMELEQASKYIQQNPTVN